MRLSVLLGRTLRESPVEAELPSHRLLLRAGMIRRVASGVYTYLPLGWRVLNRIHHILRQEMDAIGGQEISMPVVQPAELWQQTGRFDEIGPELVRFKDRSGREMVLGMTHEEVVTELARSEIESYRQLPLMLYQIQTKVRDDPRPRGGLVRVREFWMKDAYSFHRTAADLEAYYPLVYQAYLNVFRRVGISVVPVESDTGMMGGKVSHEFMMVSEFGEDRLAICPCCGYAANLEVAVRGAERPAEGLGPAEGQPAGAPSEGMQPAGLPAPPPASTAAGPGPAQGEVPQPQPVHTPGAQTIEAVTGLLGFSPRQALKTLVYLADGGLVLVGVRGDSEANETKLRKVLGCRELRLATDEEAGAAGLCPGYVSPVGLRGFRVVVDRGVAQARDLLAGANRPDYHLLHVQPGRDFEGEVADVTLVAPGDPCPRCGAGLELKRGIEAGHTFQLGTKYSEALGARFLDADDRSRPLVMGCYGIGSGRLMACIVEQNHDENGIVWPASVAPYHFHLVGLGPDPAVMSRAEEVYRELSGAGLEVVYDDRDAAPGVKFNDADLLGAPWRLTLSRRTLEAGTVEVKERRSGRVEDLPQAGLAGRLAALLEAELARYR
ncbi:MAG: proline--tRNA ligase [Acetobacteraceae bacterium]|nr:proline--tRNA ligase [Acetobacteraceae bacterium]